MNPNVDMEEYELILANIVESLGIPSRLMTEIASYWISAEPRCVPKNHQKIDWQREGF